MAYTEDEDFYDPDARAPDLSLEPGALQLCMDCAQDEDRYQVVSEPVGWGGSSTFTCGNCGNVINKGDEYCDALPLT